MGNQVIIVCGILVGFLAIPIVAGAAPEIVNGLLLLLLIGAILMNSEKWIPYLAAFGDAISAPAPATRVANTPIKS
jgi:hypothetical protein